MPTTEMNYYVVHRSTHGRKIRKLRAAGLSAVVERRGEEEAIRTIADYDQMCALFPKSSILRVH